MDGDYVWKGVVLFVADGLSKLSNTVLTFVVVSSGTDWEVFMSAPIKKIIDYHSNGTKT